MLSMLWFHCLLVTSRRCRYFCAQFDRHCESLEDKEEPGFEMQFLKQRLCSLCSDKLDRSVD